MLRILIQLREELSHSFTFLLQSALNAAVMFPLGRNISLRPDSKSNQLVMGEEADRSRCHLSEKVTNKSLETKATVLLRYCTLVSYEWFYQFIQFSVLSL